MGQAQFWQYGKAEDTAQSLTTDGHASLTSWSTSLSFSALTFSYSFPSYSMTVIDLAAVTAPRATAGSIPAVTWRELGKKSYEFVVHYSSSSLLLDAGSVDGDEIQVTGPTGLLPVTLVGISVAPNGKSLDATYRLTPPGGSWSTDDSGQLHDRSPGRHRGRCGGQHQCRRRPGPDLR